VTGPLRAPLRRAARSSPRLAALYRGLRGFIFGGASAPPGKASHRPAAEDGVGQLRRVTFVPSPRTGYRLNLVVPTVDGARTFGGIRTALDLFEAVGAETAQRRIISVATSGPVPTSGPPGYAEVAAGDDPGTDLQFVRLDHAGAPLAVRPDDVFVATFWTTAELVERIRDWQATTFGSSPSHSAYLIQDYEPGFYPWSAQSMIASDTYRSTTETIAVFNTTLLQDYFHDVGVRFSREFAFEPRILPTLRAAMDAPERARSRTVVVYGRPRTPRNAFPAIVDGLRAWRRADPRAIDWRTVSVGQAHPDIDLGVGEPLRSIGKLDLDGYASLLRESAIGVSLMVSPHPSYPPLEMAHLGLLVITNGFANKDLSRWHTNIASTDDIAAEALATRLTELCARFEADPHVGATGRPLETSFISTEPAFPFARDLAELLGQGSTAGRRSR
jgi:hypothetical protein